MQYPGGKNGAGVYHTIINQIPPHSVYIEAFAGSGAVFRYKLPAPTSYLIDLDSSVNLEASAGLPLSAETPPLEYRPDRHGRIRSAETPLRTSGATRRKRRWPPSLGSSADGARVAFDSADVICVHTDAIPWLREYAWSGDEFVYLDPPYLATARRGHHRRIYRCELRTRAEHAELLAVVKTIPAAVMLSGYRSSLYERKLKGWRSLAFTTSTRGGPAEEILWMNYPEPVALQDYRYLGETFRQRQDFKRMRERWKGKLASMPALKRQALLAVLHDQSHGSG